MMRAASSWEITVPSRKSFSRGIAMKRATTKPPAAKVPQNSAVRVPVPKRPTYSSKAATRKKATSSPTLYSRPRITRSL